MKIEVKLFASLRAKMPDSNGRGVIEMEEGSNLSDFLGTLNIPPEMSQMTLVNGQHCPADKSWRDQKKLSEGDVVSVFPPLAGGASV